MLGEVLQNSLKLKYFSFSELQNDRIKHADGRKLGRNCLPKSSAIACAPFSIHFVAQKNILDKNLKGGGHPLEVANMGVGKSPKWQRAGPSCRHTHT